jgi:hypothetical protein
MFVIYDVATMQFFDKIMLDTDVFKIIPFKTISVYITDGYVICMTELCGFLRQ